MLLLVGSAAYGSTKILLLTVLSGLKYVRAGPRFLTKGWARTKKVFYIYILGVTNFLIQWQVLRNTEKYFGFFKKKMKQCGIVVAPVRHKE